MTLTIRREDCIEAVKSFIRRNDFVLEEYNVRTSDISGLTGRYYKISTTVRVDGRVKKIHFFAKTPPILKSQRVFVVDFRYFHRELVFFKYLVPKMIASLPPGVVLPLPRCAFTRDSVQPGFVPVPGSAEEELIILEDLTHRGFVGGKFHTLDLPHCAAVMKALARFHAASILLEVRGRSGRDPLDGVASFSDDLWNLDREKAFVTRSAESTATAVCALWPQRFGGRRDGILASLNGAWAKFHAEARSSKNHVKAFIHGDAWGNNFMFSYEGGADGSGAPVEAMLVDMQIVQYLPPVYDVIFFLHVSTRRSFRDQNMMKLLECYHGELCCCMPPDLRDSVFPFESLLESYEDLKAVGPLISSAYIPKILEICLSSEIRCDPDDLILDLMNDRGQRIAYYCERSQQYREWVEESLKDCLEVLGLWV